MRLLVFTIHEPLPGKVLPVMTREIGAEEAVRRYKAVVLTTLRQLKGLENARIRLIPDPDDAEEALRFWLLPRLSDRWKADDGVFRSPGWEIDFGGSGDPFAIHASGDILCPYLGSRWVHTAMIGLERGTHQVAALAADGSRCFHAGARASQNAHLRQLPPLALIRNDEEWKLALDGPLGAELRKTRTEQTC